MNKILHGDWNKYETFLVIQNKKYDLVKEGETSKEEEYYKIALKFSED